MKAVVLLSLVGIVWGQDIVTVGAVRYSSNVEDIWERLGKALCENGTVCPQPVLFDTYEELNDALFDGYVDIAWNGPVAHVRAQGRAREQGLELRSLGQRDVDRDFEAVIIGHGAGSVPLSTEALRVRVENAAAAGQLVGGSRDSPQAYIVPLYWLRSAVGAKIEKEDVRTLDIDLGKHGDTAEGEVEAIQAVASGEADVGMVSRMMLDRADAATRAKVGVLHAVAPFDHCQFGALFPGLSEDTQEAFSRALLDMDVERHREVLRDEGLRERWIAPEDSRYDLVRRAVEDLGTPEDLADQPSGNDEL
eukprot:Hpha_TRINITY_DN15488_c3_g12::TRINITY_DN15488_c3_g12_i1::g.175629::m.175629